MRSRTLLAQTFSVVAAATAALFVAVPQSAATAATTTAAVTAARGAASPCEQQARACVDLVSHQAWLADGSGHVTFGPVPARGGKHGSATPTGMFSVLYKDEHHYSKQFDAPMPYSVFFYPGDALHADNPRAASNGCIHLTVPAARQFYQGLNQGDRVQVIG